MEAKDAAEKIVDLTTTLYCAQDFKTRRRSELLNVRYLKLLLNDTF